MAYSVIKENFKKNILIDDNTLLDYINIRLNEEGLNDLISFVNVTNYGESCYNPSDNALYINSEEIFLENADKNIPDLLKLISFKDKSKFILSNPNYGNIYNLVGINHEINHLIQKREILNETNDLKTNLFLNSKFQEVIDETFFKSFYYLKYHDRFYNEYNANIESYYEVLSLLKAYKIQSIEKDLIFTNKLISKHILYLYSDIDKKYLYSTPIKNALKIYKHLLEVGKKHEAEFCFEKDLISIIKKEKPEKQFDKLLMGFSINKDTHNYLKNVASGKIKTLNLFDDINY